MSFNPKRDAVPFATARQFFDVVVLGTSTQGTIIQFDPPVSCHDSGSYDVSFVTSDGHTVSFEEQADCGQTYHVGETVPVLYNPNNPQEAHAAIFYNLWVLPAGATIFCALGSLYSIFATYAFIKERQQRKYSHSNKG